MTQSKDPPETPAALQDNAIRKKPNQRIKIPRISIPNGNAFGKARRRRPLGSPSARHSPSRDCEPSACSSRFEARQRQALEKEEKYIPLSPINRIPKRGHAMRSSWGEGSQRHSTADSHFHSRTSRVIMQDTSSPPRR